MKITFGVISDTHLGNKEAKEEELEKFYKWISNYTDTIYHAGDFFEGIGVYEGQENDLKVWGVDEQIEYAVKNYPKVRNLETKVIAGNHEGKVWKKVGVDMCRELASLRKDITYCGRFKAEFKETFGQLWIVHPKSSAAYAISYPIQKYLRNLGRHKQPKILVFGHGHQSYFFKEDDTFCVGAGSFLGETDYTIRRGFVPQIGGWLIEIKLEGSSIKYIRPVWRGFEK